MESGSIRYFVTNLVGRSLADLLKECPGGRMPLGAALNIGIQTLEALEGRAHRWKNMEEVKRVGEYKYRCLQPHYIGELFAGCPPEYQQAMTLIDACNFSETPDYEQLYALMHQAIGNHLGPDDVALWTVASTPASSYVPKPFAPPPCAILNKRIDAHVGDPWPTQLGSGQDAQYPDQFVALWYFQGEPVFGRVWNEGGKIAANFAWFNREYTGNVGTIQLLAHMSEHVRGFDYHWKPFSEVFVFGKEREYVPVHVNHHKGDIAHAVITFNGKQILGKCDIRNEMASAGFGGKENSVNGPSVHTVTMVLTRKARTGYSFD